MGLISQIFILILFFVIAVLLMYFVDVVKEKKNVENEAFKQNVIQTKPQVQLQQSIALTKPSKKINNENKQQINKKNVFNNEFLTKARKDEIPKNKETSLPTFKNFSTREISNNNPVFENFISFDKKKFNNRLNEEKTVVQEADGIMRKNQYNRFKRIEPRTPIFYRMNKDYKMPSMY